MAVVDELIRKESDGTLSFGNYLLDKKSKISDFEHEGDLYKVKTFKEITKLERNGLFVYESVPGTTVKKFSATEKGLSFYVEGNEDAQITLELEAEKEYKIFLDKTNIGEMKTNLGGKLVLSVELNNNDNVEVMIEKI